MNEKYTYQFTDKEMLDIIMMLNDLKENITLQAKIRSALLQGKIEETNQKVQ